MTLEFLFEHTRQIHTFEASALTFECIKLFTGEHTNPEIADLVSVTSSEVDQLSAYLNSHNLLSVRSKRPSRKGRYARQLNFFSSFETAIQTRHDFQRRLETGHAVILGIGSIGSWVAEYLARAGVGVLTLIDPDLVELDNLPRQALYSRRDVGKTKVAAAKRRIREINASTKVVTLRRRIKSFRDLAPHISNASIVVNCADEPDISATNDLVSEACFEQLKPHILCGGYDGHLSYVGQTVIPFETSCWRCYCSDGRYEKQLRGFTNVEIGRTKREGGTLGAMSAVTAAIHAMEALKLLAAYYEPGFANRKAEFDFLSYDSSFERIDKNPHCQLCGRR